MVASFLAHRIGGAGLSDYTEHASRVGRMHDGRKTCEEFDWEEGIDRDRRNSDFARAVAEEMGIARQRPTAHAQRVRVVTDTKYLLHFWDARAGRWRPLVGQARRMAERAIVAGAVRVDPPVDALPLTGTLGVLAQLRVRETVRKFDVKLGCVVKVTE